jgi:hypothetical protein
MTMIIKSRARKPIVNARHSSVGYAPDGIGGVFDKNGKGNIACMSIHVGEYRILMSLEEFQDIQASLTRAFKGK